MARKQRVKVQVKTLTTVTFILGSEECAIPITAVHQIIRDVPVTKVPNVDRHVEGVINLRGIVVPILDLKRRLGLGVRSLGPEHRLLIVEQDGRRVGFSADSVGGVFEFEETRLQPAPEIVLAKLPRNFVRGVVRRGEDIVVVLDTSEALYARIARRKGDAASSAVAAGAVETSGGF